MGSAPSISDQVHHALAVLRHSDSEIAKMKAFVGQGKSIKPALRSGDKVTTPLNAIISYGTMRSYLDSGKCFFQRCKELTGEKYIGRMLDTETVKKTLATYYAGTSSGYRFKTLCAIQKVWQGCRRLGWTNGANPVTEDLRTFTKTLGEYGDLRPSRFGYTEGDAERIISYLQERNSPFTIPSRLAYECGLRISEIAFLKGISVDKANCQLHIKGKGGRPRDVAVPPNIMQHLNPSRQYQFGASRAWMNAFRAAVASAAKALGIEASGVHRMRANYAQALYNQLVLGGLDDNQARKRVAAALGHNRIDVTAKYIPKEPRELRQR
jgi:integrase